MLNIPDGAFTTSELLIYNGLEPYMAYQPKFTRPLKEYLLSQGYWKGKARHNGKITDVWKKKEEFFRTDVAGIPQDIWDQINSPQVVVSENEKNEPTDHQQTVEFNEPNDE